MLDLRWSNILFDLSLFFIYAPLDLMFGHILFGVALSWKKMGLAYTIRVVARAMQLIFFPTEVLGFVLVFIADFCICYFVFEIRGWRLAPAPFVLVAITIMTDYLTQFYALLVMPLEKLFLFVPGLEYSITAPDHRGVTTAATLTAALTALAIVWLGKRAMDWFTSRNWSSHVRLLRPIVLSGVVLVSSLLFVTEANLRFTSTKTAWSVGEQIMVLSSWLITAFYIVMDLRTVYLSHQNNTLSQQKQINDELLGELRLFRHNIANMLYGFEGKILSGDMGEIREYYEQMATKCARINNENVVGLQRIHSNAVRALLLNKIEAARVKGVPFYLDVEEHLRWRGIKDGDMCQVLGALIDNAIEAAEHSVAPQTAVEFGCIDRGMGVIIRNTYDSEADLSFLTAGLLSSKPNHEGLGLLSTRSILSGYAHATMNQIRIGRYIETILLFR